MKIYIASLFAILMYALHTVEGYHNAMFINRAEINQACVQLYPNHGVQPQTSPSPYVLELSAPYWIASDGLKCKLKSTNGGTFKGFMIQARVKNDYQSMAGYFTPIDGTKKNCKDNRALTHSDNSEKTEMEFIWNAPFSVLIGDIQFIFTVVKNKNTFWTNVTSEYIPTYYDYIATPKTTTIPTRKTTEDTKENNEATNSAPQGCLYRHLFFFSVLTCIYSYVQG